VGYVFGVLRTLYGVDRAVVLRGVAVAGLDGAAVTVMGGPSCLPDEWCGQLVPAMTVTFPAGAALPAYGDVVDLYGVTTARSLAPTGFVVVGQCHPEYADC
jgi:hypothetical protein